MKGNKRYFNNRAGSGTASEDLEGIEENLIIQELGSEIDDECVSYDIRASDIYYTNLQKNHSPITVNQSASPKILASGLPGVSEHETDF